MLKILSEDKNNLIIDAEGEIQAEDYENLTPVIEKMAEEYGSANLMMIARDIKGETWKGMKKDADFGFGAYKKVEKFAIVTDQEWLKIAVNIMSPFTHTKEKIFSLDEEDEAREWLLG